VVKPVDLNSGTSVHLVEDEVILKDAFGDVTGSASDTRGQPLARLALIEEYLEGREVSVEAVTVDGRTHIIGVTDKVVDHATLVECGHRFPARLGDGDRRAVETLAREALAAIGFTYGLSHTEVKLTARGPRLVEINPRQGGGYIFELISLVTGVNPLGLLIDLALGAVPRLDSIGTVPSAAVSFVMPREDGERVRLDVDELVADPLVHAWGVSAQARPGRARDNNDRPGHVITVGAAGVDPLRHAQALTYRAP
jgi:argininosuccinate lyase